MRETTTTEPITRTTTTTATAASSSVCDGRLEVAVEEELEEVDTNEAVFGAIVASAV